MVSRAVLSTDYDGVSLFSKKNTVLYEKEAQSWLKMDKIIYLCINEPFFTCSHRVSIEGKSPYNEYHIVDSRRKIFPSNLMTFWATIYHA